MESKEKKRIRIEALDGIRALLAVHIVFGHFLCFAGPSKFCMRFFAQVNVTVGPFFALSGYVTAYTCTKVGKKGLTGSFQASSLKNWWISKAMTFYPLHWFVLLLFGPMFVYSNIMAAPSITTGLNTVIFNGVLSFTLTQAWFPVNRAEIWNAPTWFLSSLSFCNLVLAIVLPEIARMDKSRLRLWLFWLFWINLLPILGYFWLLGGSNTWTLVEGMTQPNDHPSLSLFNVLRFLPVFNAAETLMGALACRLVMLDSNCKRQSSSTWSVVVPFGIAIGVLIGRAREWIPDCSDLLIRKCIVIPVFLNFVMALHRNAVLVIVSNESKTRKDPISVFLSTKIMMGLGNLSFPIYILHGPIGQLFYKRAIARKLWGGVLGGKGYFALYVAVVLVSAILVQKKFSNRKVIEILGKGRKELMQYFQ